MSSDPPTGRRFWARQLIERQSANRPNYGSTEWLMLPNEHPDKIAACVVAAECWASAGDCLEEDLRREIESAQMAFKRADDADYARGIEEHRERCMTTRPATSFTERRAAQLQAARPRPGDFPGRSKPMGGDIA